MAGVILENMSTNKILKFCAILLFLQIVCFLVGGLIAPMPTNPVRVIGTKCIDNTVNHLKLFPPRGKNGCDKIRDFTEATEKHITAEEIVFSFQIPHPPHSMSRSFQFMVGVLTMEIERGQEGEAVGEDAEMSMMITMGYNNEPNGDGEWHPLLQKNESRKLNCIEEGDDDEERGGTYNCEPLSLFELSSVHHKHYLINIRLPVDLTENSDINKDIGLVKDLQIVEIHQNGGFTTIWLTMKSVFFPLVLGMMLFFYRRVSQLGRPPLLMERTILALALMMSFINFPLEWLTFVAEVPAMLLIGDIRQGAFYAMLFSFWIIFIGEHMMDSVERNSLKAYRQQLVAVVIACLCLLTFDLAERGSQLRNPFYSVWNTEQGYKLAMGFIIMAAACIFLYFCFLLFMVFCLFRNLRTKSVAFNSMPKHRKKYYEGSLYRFCFFMVFTMFSAIMTVVFFIMSQVSEHHNWHIDDEDLPKFHYTSWFFTGVYGLWNVYVLAVLFLYSPSHKDETLLSNNSHMLHSKNLVVGSLTPGLLYRFRFFMVFTMFSAVMTVIFFIMSQVSEIHNWYIDDEDQPKFHYTSGFFTGVYGLWNVYVLAVLFLYSPSHKDEPLLSRADQSEGSQVEFEMTESTTTPMVAPTPATPSMAQSAPSEVYQLLRKTTVD